MVGRAVVRGVLRVVDGVDFVVGRIVVVVVLFVVVYLGVVAGLGVNVASVSARVISNITVCEEIMYPMAKSAQLAYNHL